MSVNDLDMYACCHLQQAYSHKTLKINHFSAQNEKNNTFNPLRDPLHIGYRLQA